MPKIRAGSIRSLDRNIALEIVGVGLVNTIADRDQTRRNAGYLWIDLGRTCSSLSSCGRLTQCFKEGVLFGACRKLRNLARPICAWIGHRLINYTPVRGVGGDRSLR